MSTEVTRPRGMLRGAALLVAVPTLLLGALMVLPFVAPGAQWSYTWTSGGQGVSREDEDDIPAAEFDRARRRW